jgi:hypothetical protein
MAYRILAKPMNPVFIVAGDILTCAGDLDQTWSTLQTCRTALVPRQLHRSEQAWPLGLIPDLPEEGRGSNRRLEGLFDQLFCNLPKIAPNTPLICATTKGAVDELLISNGPYNGQPWQIGERLCEILSLTGKTTTVTAACASSTIAVIHAALCIAAGQCDQILVVGFDLVSRFVLDGFASLKSLSPRACRPFDKHRDGLSLGEGGGWLLLSNQKHPFNTTECICSPTGWGITCDATHITAPCRKGSGLISAINQAVQDNPMAVGGINAHGTGTVYNDEMELTAFAKICGHSPPICSIKGSIGHCLGAAGIIEIAISLKTLEAGFLPPTVGLIEPDHDIPNVSGKVSLPLLSPSILSCNSGFGGINAAILFSNSHRS